MRATLTLLLLNFFWTLELSFGNVIPAGLSSDASDVCTFGKKASLPNHEVVRMILMYDKSDIESSLSLVAVNVDLKDKSLIYVMRDMHQPIKPSTRVSVWQYEMSMRSAPSGHVTDCVKVGHLEEDDNDRFHISLCNKVIGWFEYGRTSYTIINGTIQSSSDTYTKHMDVIVSKEERLQTTRESSVYNDHTHIRGRRQTLTTLTIETVVILDEDYIDKMAKAGYTTDEDLTDLMKLKWSGVQAEWGKGDQLGYHVLLEIKEMVFWRINPNWYSPSTYLANTLISVCGGTNSKGLYTNYDHIHLYTGTSGTDVAGKAYTGKICSDVYKCAVSTATSMTEYVITAHEIGHCMGMSHDGDMGCPSPNDGIMGSKTSGWSICSVANMTTLLGNTAQTGCLTTEDVSSAGVIQLQGVWPGMLYSDDEICEFNNGPGFRKRKFPLNTLGDCGLYSCVNMNTTSTDYGIMFNYQTPTDGSYCGEEMVCSTQIVGGGYHCIRWNQTGLDLASFQVVNGGWSAWGPATECSRSCGTGISYKTRTCSNPKPQNSAWCEGEEYDPVPCNTQPCDGDPATESDLKNARASETCKKMKTTNVYKKIGLNSTNFLDTGTKLNGYEHGQCEVKCSTVSGYSVNYWQRFGLMPDGTPCDPPGLDSFIETNNLARMSGRYGRCVQGYCHMFGCDYLSGSTSKDGCGVCGGDNSTCQVAIGVYNELVNTTNTRVVVTTLPTGTYNIVFYFNYGSMVNNYIELWTLENVGVIIGSYDRLLTPVNYAGAYWYGIFSSQYLYAEGPISRPVVIKYHQRGANPNVGITYAYSLPTDDQLNACTGPCENGGTWNQSLCGCQCATGFYGKTCNTNCNRLCHNGMNLTSTGCGCDCQGNTYGQACDCRYPFKGKNCQDCKITSCQNGGTFNSSACRCSCLDGYGGLDCSSTCKDAVDTATCLINVGKGWCESRNEQMEAECYMSCGLCVPVITTTSSVQQTTTIPAKTTAVTDDTLAVIGNSQIGTAENDGLAVMVPIVLHVPLLMLMNAFIWLLIL